MSTHNMFSSRNNKLSIVFSQKKKSILSGSMIDLIVLGFNDRSTLVGHFVISQRKGENRRENRGDTKRGTGKKEEQE